MRILITGVTGFVASHLAEYLLLLNEKESLEGKKLEIFGTYRWRSPQDNIKNVKNKITLIECELTDAFSVQKTINETKPDVIFHIAAQSYVPAGTNYPATTIDANIKGTLNLLEAVKNAKIDPVIHVCSTSDVYGGYTTETEVDENAPLRPFNQYAVSKAGQDLLAMQYHFSYGMKIVRTRACIKTGPRRGHVFAESSFARQIAEIEAGQKEPVIRVGNLNSIRSFVDVRDAVRAYWLVVQKGRAGEVYNISGETRITIKEVLDTLLSLSKFNEKIKVEVDPKLVRNSDTMLPTFNCDKFKKETGWKAEIEFKKTMGDLLDYWRERVKQ